MHKESQNTQELEEKIRLLMAENDMLAERAEDSLLLGLISEKVSLCEKAEQLDGIALEQATVLKDLAAGFCLELRPDTAMIVDAFIMYSSVNMRGTSVQTDNDFSNALRAGDTLLDSDCRQDGFFSTLRRSLPVRVNAWLALSAGNCNGRECVYIFADEEGNPRLRVISSMLRRVIELVTARRENLKLVEKLRELNASLDTLVDSRTRELQATNATLKTEIAVRLKTEDKLLASLNDKTVLLKEVHHRVKNNLQIVSSLLSLQANELDEGILRDKFSESQDRVHAMALVHERLYLAEDMSSIDFGEYLRELSERLQQVYDKPRVATVVEAGNIYLSLDQSIPCGLLANELISNAYKHAYADRESGTISIILACEDSATIVLEVKDDGAGLPEAACGEKHNSIGLTLVHMLAKQLGGAVHHDNNPGCHFKVRFPLRKHVPPIL